MLMDYPLASGIVAASSQLIHGLYDFNIELILYIYTYMENCFTCTCIPSLHTITIPLFVIVCGSQVLSNLVTDIRSYTLCNDSQ